MEMIPHALDQTMAQEKLDSKFKCVKRLRTFKLDLTKATKMPARITSERESEKLMAEAYCSGLSLHMNICDRQLMKIRRRSQRLQRRDAEIIERMKRIRKKVQELADSPVKHDVLILQERNNVPICETGCKESESLFEISNCDITSAQKTEMEDTGSEMSGSSFGQFMDIDNDKMLIAEPSSDVSFSTCNLTLQNEKDGNVSESETGSGIRPVPPPRRRSNVSLYQHSKIDNTKTNNFHQELRIVGMTSPKSLGTSSWRVTKQQKSSKFKITKTIMKKIRRSVGGGELI